MCSAPWSERAGLEDDFEIASAGTYDGHVGQPPSPPAIEAAARRGYDIAGLRARPLVADDIAHFDYPLAMDRSHLADMRWMAPRELADRPQMFTEFGPPIGVVDVADPYGGPTQDYERALDLIEAGCKGLLARLAPLARKAT